MAISISVRLAVAAVLTDSRTADSFDMVSDDFWRAVAAEPILLPRLGMVPFLSKPCRRATQGKLKALLHQASRVFIDLGGG